MNIYQKLPKLFFALAPMDDVTDTVFRQIIAKYAKPDLFFTEFVNADGLQSPGRDKLIKRLKYSKIEKPIIAQIWGKSPLAYTQTTKDIIKMGFNGIDINMGCPDKSVIKNGCCIALINNRTLAKELIEATKKANKNKLPISVKTRLGLNNIDLSWHEFLLKQDLDALIIHGRTAKQMSKVPADWGTVGKIREMRDKLSPKTLIIGNGDVETLNQAKELAKKYKLDGVMIGRGVLNNPFVFSKSNQWQNFEVEQKKQLYLEHVKLFAKTYKNNERKIYTLNKFCKIYINGFDGAKELRDKLMKVKSIKELINILTKS